MKRLRAAQAQEAVEVVMPRLVEPGLEHTAAHRYVIVEQGSDLDAFAEIEKH